MVLAVFSLLAVWPVWQFQGQASSTLLIVLVLIFNLPFSKGLQTIIATRWRARGLSDLRRTGVSRSHTESSLSAGAFRLEFSHDWPFRLASSPLVATCKAHCNRRPLVSKESLTCVRIFRIISEIFIGYNNNDIELRFCFQSMFKRYPIGKTTGLTDRFLGMARGRDRLTSRKCYIPSPSAAAPPLPPLTSSPSPGSFTCYLLSWARIFLSTRSLLQT